MKRLKIIVLLCLISPFLKGQDYVPFPTDSVAWNSFHVYFDFSGTQVIYFGYEEYFYFLMGKTTIDSIQYSNLYKGGDAFNIQSQNTEFFGLIREENKKVFFYPDSAFSDTTLMYDFGLPIGGIIDNDTEFGFHGEFLDSIDSLQLLNGEFRKRYWYNNGADVIEGIGAIEGGILTPGMHLHYISQVRCFTSYNELLYSSQINGSYYENKDQCLDLSIVIDVEEIQEKQFSIYPNPFNQSFHLKLREQLGQAMIKIFDMHGKEVYSYQSLSQSSVNINFESSPGIYLMQIFSEGNLIGMEKVMRY